MQIRKVCTWIFLVACGGLLIAQAVDTLEKPLTVLAETELKIERGECFVFWKPVYCPFPGNGYRLEAVNGSRQGKNPVRQFTVILDGGEEIRWPSWNDNSPRREKSVCLMGRSVLRVTLRGEPGEGIVMSIRGQPGQVDLSTHSLHGPEIVNNWPSIPHPPGVMKPPPVISLKADKTAIALGQMVGLAWNIQNAQSARFTFGNLGEVESSGSAQVWPEQDTTYCLEVPKSYEGFGTKMTVKLEVNTKVLVKVTVPDPELEVSLDPQTVFEGQETTLSWKTKNARLVRFVKSEYSSLPLSGKMKIKPNRYSPIELQAENGEKKVRKSVEARVLDLEAEKQRAEAEKASRIIPKEIDKTLRGLWQDLKEAMKAGDAEKAASFFCFEERGDYLAIYKDLKKKLPQVGEEMKEIEFLEFQGDGAIYRTKRKEIIKGKEYDISYRVYFIRDEDGQWRIYKF